jgi:tRNA(Ile)-lysidine synthase
VAERRIAVAFSGGRDSTALLHATLQQARHDEVQVLALHVHHGLSPHADAWLAHGAAQCKRWARRGLPVEFVEHRITDRPAKGESVEAWARRARYRALGAMALARGATVVLLAHHRRDQAETVLLQALRGAGVAGLSGMPRSVQRDGITWLRPWLDRPRAEIEAYIHRHRLAYVDDASNADPRFARNRLRLEVWPALAAAFPQSETALASAAEWAQQASALLDEIAALDLAQIGSGEGPLDVRAWTTLSAARRRNALRAWLRQRQGVGAPASLVARLLAELPTARSARWPLADGELRLYRGRLSLAPNLATTRTDAPQAATLSVQRAGRYALPDWQGALTVERVRAGGVPLAWLARLELRPRGGGEQFQAGSGRPPRSLKKQYQEAGVPMWERGGPLIYSGGQLVFVPGLGLDARVIGLPGQPLVTLRWLPLDSNGRSRPA